MLEITALAEAAQQPVDEAQERPQSEEEAPAAEGPTLQVRAWAGGRGQLAALPSPSVSPSAATCFNFLGPFLVVLIVS